jgi:hypothetical protein
MEEIPGEDEGRAMGGGLGVIGRVVVSFGE